MAHSVNTVSQASSIQSTVTSTTPGSVLAKSLSPYHQLSTSSITINLPSITEASSLLLSVTSPALSIPPSVTLTNLGHSTEAHYSYPHLQPPADPQVTLQADLVNRYGQEKFNRHQPWVILKIRGRQETLVPSYHYQSVSTIADVWKEWAEGLNGFISVRELMEKWETAWRQGDAGIRTEGGRRMNIIKLIEELQAKRRWSLSLALHFLKEKYSFYTPRMFSDYLIKNKRAGWADVHKASLSYP